MPILIRSWIGGIYELARCMQLININRLEATYHADSHPNIDGNDEIRWRREYSAVVVSCLLHIASVAFSLISKYDYPPASRI